MNSNSSSSYPDVILNAFKSIQAWKSAALLLGVLLVFAIIAIVRMATHQSVLLVPQSLSNAKSAVAINLGDPFSPDYLTGVAKGDLHTLLNWTPDNIDQQYGLFVERLAPALRDSQKEVLINEGKQHREEGLTQSFYVTRTFVKGVSVQLHGILVRSAGGREVFRGPATYDLSYINGGNGLLLISGVAQPGAKPSESKN